MINAIKSGVVEKMTDGEKNVATVGGITFVGGVVCSTVSTATTYVGPVVVGGVMQPAAIVAAKGAVVGLATTTAVGTVGHVLMVAGVVAIVGAFGKGFIRGFRKGMAANK